MNIEELLSKMTLKEKVGQLCHGFYGFNATERDENGNLQLTQAFKDYVLKFGSIGVLFSYFRSDPYSQRSYANGGITLKERESAYNMLQKFVIENTRLGIPVLLEENTPHGRQVLDALMYPSNINVGASFNPGLYKDQIYHICHEARLGGVYCPNFSLFDMAVDPRWGRSEECFSEDPYLASQYSKNAVLGANEANVLICCKHYVAQGAALGAHNGCSTNIGERELREIHLPAVKSAVEAGAPVIMAAYNDYDGVPCHASKFLLQDILKDEFGFKGIIRADSCAIDNVNEMTNWEFAKGAAISLEAGVDVGLMDTSYAHLEEAVAKGYIKEEVIDNAVRRLLQAKKDMGLFDNPYIEDLTQSTRYVESKVNEQVAYDMATESLVLLKNVNKLLPLSNDKKLLLIGENLGDVYYLLGDYTSERKNGVPVKDVFDGQYIEGWNFKKGITVTDEELKDAVESCDAIIFGCGGSSVRDFNSVYLKTGAVGKSYNYMDCGEGCDLSTLELIPAQIELIKRIRKFNKPIISLVIAGRAYLLKDIVENSDSVLFAGYPGDKGAIAIKDTLYGVKNNFGRLAISLPKSLGQLPIFYNYRVNKDYFDIDCKPLFGFGYGLSYSNFIYSDLTVDVKDNIVIKFNIANDSDVSGKAVPQLYIHRNTGTVMPRNKELKRFDKVEIAAHETKQITFILEREDLLEWSINRKYEANTTNIDVMVGEGSTNILLKTKGVKI